VNHDHLEADAVGGFILEQAIEDRIQAIAFGGGPGVRHQGEVHAGRAAGGLGHRCAGKRIVPIRAGEEIIIGILDSGQVAFQHPPDHAVLFPQRNQNGDPALGNADRLRGRRPAAAAPALGENGDQCDEQIVQAAEQNPDCQANQADHEPVVGRQ